MAIRKVLLSSLVLTLTIFSTSIPADAGIWQTGGVCPLPSGGSGGGRR
jgi:hypothetical protein